MNNQVIFLYVLQGISGVIGLLMAYMVLKYLNHKALGMQTINDQMIKDKIYTSSLYWFINIISEIIFNYKANPLNHNLALFIALMNAFVVIASVWQMSVLLVIRYMSVFYQNVMNNVDDCLIIKITRSFVGLTALISVIAMDFENIHGFQLLTGKESKDDSWFPVKPIIFSVLFCLIILILTQYQIEKFKKSVDCQAQFDQMETSTNRIEIGMLCISILIVLFIALWKTDSVNEILKKMLIVQFINTNVIPIIFIVRNENMYSYFKRNSIMKLLCFKM